MSRSERGRDQITAPSRPKRTWQRTALGLHEAEPAKPLAPVANGEVSTWSGTDTHGSSASTATPVAPEDESFAARLRYLFAATRQANGRPWSANAVARASGGRLTPQAVYSLFRGATPNPKLETILALSEVLGIDPEYFVSPGALSRLKATHAGRYAALEADPHIAFVSRRMGQMTPEDKAIIVAMVHRLSADAASEASLKDAASDPFDAAVMTQTRQDLP